MTMADCEAVLELNRAVVEVTSPMDAKRFRELYSFSSIRLSVVLEQKVVGFVLAMEEGCGYDNGNRREFLVPVVD
jgi:hypothetical protein